MASSIPTQIHQDQHNMGEQHPGLTDKAVAQGHDFIEHAEAEEAQSHGDTQTSTQKKGAGLEDSDQAQTQPSMIDKVKETLHMK